MDSATLLDEAIGILAKWNPTATTPEADRRDVIAEAAQLPEMAAALHGTKWGYLSAITGLDHGAEAGQIEILYHFVKEKAVLTIRVKVPRSAPAVPSICAVYPSASLYERELIEMLGITVQDTPDVARLFLPEEWPIGVFPLRKDFIAPAPAEVSDGTKEE